ncbi:hypothetical protein [Burkholderia ubonensis]|uniref:hypothetical protein n=1 Tax=Burkholderia ubonensis TaxID=101571 RepID=UPI000AAB78D9|nr:hypothetical protein [Burkholderia ubonensis]
MTTENKKSPTPEQASEAVPQRQRTENPTAEAIFEQASGGGNLICSKFEDGKSRTDALTDDAARKIAHRIYCRLGLCGSNPLCFNGADATTQQRWISAIKDACPLFAASPVEQPAAAPADERATWSNARDSLAVAMSGFAGRSGNRDFNAAIGVLDAITEPGLPLAWLRTARTASANETGAEGADDLNERAHLAAGKWANANTPISEALANRDGYIAGARFPAMAAAAPADYKGDAVPKWIFDQVVNTLAPAWDYVQTHQEQFNALAGDDKTKIVVEEFLKHARAAASPAAEARAEIASKMERLINAVNAYTGIGGWYAKQIQDLCSSLLMTLAAPQPAQADAPATIPDECVASGASCSYAPEGRHGEMQCRYCGKAQADALDEEQRDALNEAICWANDDGLPGTADQLRSILALHEQADAPAEAREPHSDDVAVDSFAAVMKHKLALARDKGRGGWETCSPADLSRMLREHVEKGDPRDVANFCMMLWHHGSPIVIASPAARVESLTSEQVSEVWDSMPGGGDGFMKQWGYYQFALEILNRAQLLNGADNAE